MNSRSKLVLLGGTALVALMFVFPPWEYYDNDSSTSSSAGYHFFLNPPNPRTAEFRLHVRFPNNIVVRKHVHRLIIQLFITIPATLGFAIIVRPTRSVLSIFLGLLFFLPGVIVIVFFAWLFVG